MYVINLISICLQSNMQNGIVLCSMIDNLTDGQKHNSKLQKILNRQDFPVII